MATDLKTAIAHYEAALKEAFPRGATGEVFHHWNEARYLIATEALDKMAENARELGLDYDVKSDHRLMEQPAQQEPPTVAELLCVCGAEWEWRNRDWELVATPPAQRKPLTDEEIESINVRLAGSRDLARLFARAIEAAHGIKGDA